MSLICLYFIRLVGNIKKQAGELCILYSCCLSHKSIISGFARITQHFLAIAVFAEVKYIDMKMLLYYRLIEVLTIDISNFQNRYLFDFISESIRER